MPIGAFKLNTIAKSVAAAVNSVTATGGDSIFYNNVSGTTYKIHQFTNNGLFIISATTGSPTTDILLVGGGGAGGGVTTTTGAGGGGGGGAVVYQTGVSVTAQTYTIAVGANGTGVSGANGNAGSVSTGLGYTANGGAAGTVNSAATNGGGSGANSSTSYTSTAGTYAYKGGNSFGSGTASARASGGGAGAGGAGVNASSNTGGNAGPGIQNNIDGNNYYYGSGGGGSGQTTSGLGYNNTGSTATGGFGDGKNSASDSLAQYGSGGGGALNTATAAAAGGAGKKGTVIIRYPTSTNFTQLYQTSVTSTSATITIPSSAQIGDIAVLFDVAYNSTSTAPTSVTPSGFSSLQTPIGTSAITPATKTAIWYKTLVSGDPGSSLTGMSGTTSTQKLLIIYRPTLTPNLISVGTENVNSSSTAPPSVSLTFNNKTNYPYIWYIGFILYASNGSITTRTSSGGTPTRELNVGTNLYVKLFEATDGTTSFSSSDVSGSMTDYGTNTLTSGFLTFN